MADGGISFRHALVRRSAGARHPAQLRRTAYLALAEAAGPQASRARYWAAAALGPDESIAVALEGAAWDAQDAFTAAAALEQAARLSPGVRDRARRLAEALAAAHLVGDPDWVGDLYQEFTRIDAAAEPTFLAAAAMSTALSLSSFQEEAFDLLLDVCERTPPGDGSLTLALASVAAAVADQSALPQHRSRLAVLLARTESRTRAGSESIGSLARLDDPEVRSTLRAVVSLVATPPGSAARLLRGLEQPRLGALRTVRSGWPSGSPSPGSPTRRTRPTPVCGSTARPTHSCAPARRSVCGPGHWRRWRTHSWRQAGGRRRMRCSRKAATVPLSWGSPAFR